MRDDGHLETRSFQISGKLTTIALEPNAWSLLEEISEQEMMPLPDLIREIEGSRGQHPRASALRVYVMTYYATKAHEGELVEECRQTGGRPIGLTRRRPIDRPGHKRFVFRCLDCIRNQGATPCAAAA